uniref:Putative LOC101237757 [Hydra vulgaris] n=1 Tax=Lepeophtheirus salmonis TaxID=72036 RepID=A0A0K2UUM0_LEPSM
MVIVDTGRVVLGASLQLRAKRGRRVFVGKTMLVKVEDGDWTVKWDWKKKPRLNNIVGQYAIPQRIKGKFDEEINKWIQKGWLEVSSSKDGGVIPLIAGGKKRKGK